MLKSDKKHFQAKVICRIIAKVFPVLVCLPMQHTLFNLHVCHKFDSNKIQSHISLQYIQRKNLIYFSVPRDGRCINRAPSPVVAPMPSPAAATATATVPCRCWVRVVSWLPGSPKFQSHLSVFRLAARPPLSPLFMSWPEPEGCVSLNCCLDKTAAPCLWRVCCKTSRTFRRVFKLDLSTANFMAEYRQAGRLITSGAYSHYFKKQY